MLACIAHAIVKQLIKTHFAIGQTMDFGGWINCAQFVRTRKFTARHPTDNSKKAIERVAQAPFARA